MPASCICHLESRSFQSATENDTAGGMHASRVWSRASWLMGMFMQAGSFIGKNGSDVEQLRAELGSEVEIKIANDVSLLVPMLGGKLPEGVAASDEGVKIEGKPALVLSALSTIALKLLAYQVGNLCFPASWSAIELEDERCQSQCVLCRKSILAGAAMLLPA